jgi:hypothetical protein
MKINIKFTDIKVNQGLKASDWLFLFRWNYIDELISN